MSTTLHVSDQLCVIRLEGEIDISRSEELKSALVEALSNRRPLHLDLMHASELDVTAIQLLWAAARDAAKLGISLEISDGVPEGICQIARDGGFEGFPGSLATSTKA